MKFVVAFSSPKRSAKTVDVATKHAKSLGAEIVLLRVVPDPEKVGVVAQLISTDRPADKAKSQIDEVVARLKQQGIEASGIVKVGEVGKSIAATTEEIGADLLFVGTAEVTKKGSGFFFKKDPIVHYLVENCSVSLFLVRNPDAALLDAADDLADTDSAPPSQVAQ